MKRWTLAIVLLMMVSGCARTLSLMRMAVVNTPNSNQAHGGAPNNIPAELADSDGLPKHQPPD